MEESKHGVNKLTIVVQFHYIFIDIHHYEKEDDRMIGFFGYKRQIQQHYKYGLVKDEIR